MSSAALNQLIELLQQHCLLGQVHYRQWRRLNDSFRDRSEVGNLAPTFFIFSAEAHLNSALLILNRFVDKSRDTLSIRQFLASIRASADKFPRSTPGIIREAVDEDLRSLDDVEGIVENIRSHRNDQFLHLSKTLLAPPHGVVPAEQSFQYADIYALLQLVGTILNRYAIFLDGSELHMEIMNESEDFAYLLTVLSKSFDRIEEEDGQV